jgi:hypothetical protein
LSQQIRMGGHRLCSRGPLNLFPSLVKPCWSTKKRPISLPLKFVCGMCLRLAAPASAGQDTCCCCSCAFSSHFYRSRPWKLDSFCLILSETKRKRYFSIGSSAREKWAADRIQKRQETRKLLKSFLGKEPPKPFYCHRIITNHENGPGSGSWFTSASRGKLQCASRGVFMVVLISFR